MNAHDRSLPDARSDEAKLHYSDGDYAIMRPGRHVICAVSGVAIPLEALRYWNPVLQEAYAGPKEALQRWRQLNPKA